MTFKPAAGKESLKVVPDLATSLGKASADAKTWTYTIRKGVKFEDGTEITSKDVKYAVERSNFAPEALSNGPTYFKPTSRAATSTRVRTRTSRPRASSPSRPRTTTRSSSS